MTWQTIQDRLMNDMRGVVAELVSYQPQKYESCPTPVELEEWSQALEADDFPGAVACVIALNRRYVDGWHASARIAGVAHGLHTANPATWGNGNPNKWLVERVPLVTDVLRVMRAGASQQYAVEMLGGNP